MTSKLNIQVAISDGSQYSRAIDIALKLGYPRTCSNSGQNLDASKPFFFKLSGDYNDFWISHLDQSGLMKAMTFEEFVAEYDKKTLTVKDLETYLDLIEAIKEAEDDVRNANENLTSLIKDKKVLQEKIGVEE